MKPIKVYSKVKKSVVHQDEAIKKMILTVNHNLQYGLYSKQNVLLIGSIGVGKTLLCKKCAEAMGLSIYRINSSFADGSLKRFQMNEAIAKLAGKSQGSEMKVEGIVLLENADQMFINDADSVFLSMANSPEFFVGGGDGVHGFYDISGVTFIAEGGYDDSRKTKFDSKRMTGFCGDENPSIAETIKEGNDPSISSKFPTIIEMNPLSEEFVRDFLQYSDLSTLNSICEGVETTPLEIDQIAKSIIDRRVGLHSAAAATSEVMFPKLEKSIFHQK